MNHIFKLYLRKFVFVFFDDIPVFSKGLKDHITHLRTVLPVLLSNQLYAKQSKCVFGCGEVEYLGHLISGQGIRTDPKKTEARQQWPMPRTVKVLRGFLGLIGYYRKFIQNYGTIAAPLTTLLKKDAFTWIAQANSTFVSLKQAVSNPLVLALLDFSKTFVVVCDAFGSGIGLC